MFIDPRVESALKNVGENIYNLICELYPICRSITGDGLRKTLKILQNHIPIQIHEVPSGTKVFDWVIPKEWNIRDAYVKNSNGEKVVNFQESNLHVLNYSIPIKKVVSLKELKEHLFSLPSYPDWVPYKTSYYKEDWGFCFSHNRLLQLKEGEYEVFIDSTLENGFLSYGELYLPGNEENEILISCHACHPSLCNDNLSGVAVVTFLAKHIRNISRRYSYRFLFIPATIGSIAWLALNEDKVNNIKHGLVAACLGDPGKLTYKKTRLGNAEIDKAVIHVLKHSGDDFEIMEFSPYGYDERQYCSPGFNLPVGSLKRTPNSKFPEYHTSADNLDFVKTDYLADSFSKYLSVFNLLEKNKKYMNQNPKCEPQLGKRGLYSSIGTNELALLWVLNLSDGNNTLLDISDRANLDFDSIYKAATVMLENNLLQEYLK